MEQSVYVIDIETESVLDGFGCTVPWEGKIIGVGLCWGEDFQSETTYYSGDQIPEILKWLSESKVPLVGYNALFEVSWLSYHFEELSFNWQGDAALYAIALDNSANGFSLKDTAPRLVNYEPWEQEIQLYCVDTFKCAPSKWGKYIPKLPYDVLQEYCRKDCHATWMIWQRGCRELNIDCIMQFFMAEVMMTSEAYIAGTLIDREKATALYNEYESKVQEATERFLTHPELMPHIERALRNRYEKECATRLEKSKTKKIKILPFEEWCEKNPFNPGSDAQLREVFKSQRLFWVEGKDGGFKYPAYTDGGLASLSADYIHLYGIGGQILAEAGENSASINKLKHILADSEHDLRCHFDINLCSVTSTRVSSNGLNIVATPLDTEIGDCFVADDGWLLGLPDVAAMEPTISAILTDDKQLKYCSYFGEGIRPFYKDGLLHIDDAYLCYLSRTKRWGEEIMDQFNADEWMDDAEGVKKKFKRIRQAGKKFFLMTLYGSGVETICDSTNKELKITIPVQEGKQLINTLWAVFPDMYKYICTLKAQAECGMKIKTWLGFPITPSPSMIHCAFNYRVQTEAAHVMKQLIWQMFVRKTEWWKPAIVNIHDATCFMFHEDRLADMRAIVDDSLRDLNASLEPFLRGIKFRLSFHYGKTLRQAKEG
jgi:DNA polymerase I-like protein with 3'-5' exonuclease and polymerase domains